MASGSAEAGQPERLRARQLAEPRGEFRRLRQIDARRIGAPDLEDQRLLDGEPAIAAEGVVRRCRRSRPRPSAAPAGSACGHLRTDAAIPARPRANGERVGAEGRRQAAGAWPLPLTLTLSARREERWGEGTCRRTIMTAPPSAPSRRPRGPSSVLTSVEATTMRSASSGRSGSSRDAGTPPSTPFSASFSITSAALPGTRIVNSLKNVSLSTSRP